MRDRAFAVTGGRVTGARRVDNPHHEASGMEPNREWRITVEPDDGAGEVTVALPATADCESANAICTADRSPLSAAVTASVPAGRVFGDRGDLFDRALRGRAGTPCRRCVQLRAPVQRRSR